MIPNYKIPFCKQTNDLISDTYWYKEDDIEWKDNYFFEDQLELVTYNLGRSAVHFIFKDSNDDQYAMSIKAYFTIVNKIWNGRILGKWTFTKNGRTCTIIPYKE